MAPPTQRSVDSVAARWLPGALLCLGFALAPYFAQASMPDREDFFQGCVIDGFILSSPTSYGPLEYRDKVDWSKFEGRTVRYKRRIGRNTSVLVVPPSAVGPCDPALVAAALPRALAQRAENEFVLKEYEKGLGSIRHAIELAQQDCEFAATYVFMLERLGRRKEADAEAARVAGITCSHSLYDQRLRILRQRYLQ
jgi:hypothetical protein